MTQRTDSIFAKRYSMPYDIQHQIVSLRNDYLNREKGLEAGISISGSKLESTIVIIYFALGGRQLPADGGAPGQGALEDQRLILPWIGCSVERTLT